ncbi:flagellar hook-basal body complex protein FliE [Xylanibacillus composti]|uniref:Flagellar hook-basal body complex protein FliE n=1 Tax=Xylanibacillus composti TaxID=1572762 RepID=A0A8J4H4P6_9BACL|nr:flagellar hook-basal body complex protein FliE [Xylanibacillus composti]GIQ68648.1 flagellar hook-basal body complex protein FliE [Xylanibacillus composti]
MINPVNAAGAEKVLAAVNKEKSAGAVAFGESFASFLDDAMGKLQAQHGVVEQLGNQFMVGNLDDVHKLTIANEKALLGLELTVQVRNKAVEAYQEIMRMQI